MTLNQPLKKTAHHPELLTRKLVRLLRLFDKEASHTLKAYSGLRILDWRILATLAQESPMTVRAMAEHLHISRSEASRSAAVLHQKGLVLRQEDEEDRRSAWFFITAKGRELFNQIMPKRQVFMDEITAHIPQQERECFDRVLNNLIEHMEHLNELKGIR